jgi:hypothetical protein
MSKTPGLRPREAVGEALREFARHILAEGRTAVEDRKRIEAVAVHDFRAAMKSWRAFLRLVEPHLKPNDRGWRTEARDLARMLAGARDAQAALDAVADAERHTPSHRLSSQSWDTIRTKLEDLRSSAETASLTNNLRTRISGAMDRAEARVERWPLDDLTFSDVARGLRDHYRRARDLIPDDWRPNCMSCDSAWWCTVIRWSWSRRSGRGSAKPGSARRKSCATSSAPVRTWRCCRAMPSHISRCRAGGRDCSRWQASGRASMPRWRA